MIVLSEVLEKVLEYLGLDEISFAVISLLDLIVFLGASVGRGGVNVANDEKSADLSGDADADTVPICDKQGTSLASHTQHEDDDDPRVLGKNRLY